MNQSTIDEGLAGMREAFSDLGLELIGSFDPQEDELIVSCKAQNSKDILDRHLELYYSVLYFVSLQAEGKKFRFELFLTQGETQAIEHTIVLETSVELMPESGGVTRAVWDAYENQLYYTIDDAPVVIASPPLFLDEEELACEGA